MSRRNPNYYKRAPTLRDAGKGILIIGPWGYQCASSELWLNNYLRRLPQGMPIRCISRTSGCAPRLARAAGVPILYTFSSASTDYDVIKHQFTDSAMILAWTQWKGASDSSGWHYVREYMSNWRRQSHRRLVYLYGNCKDYCVFPGNVDDFDAMTNMYVPRWNRPGFCLHHKRLCHTW